jgi:hypothetical protein
MEVEGSEGMGAKLGGGEDVGRRGQEWRFGAQESTFDAQVKRESQRERMRKRDRDREREREREREQKRMVSEQIRQQLRVRPSSALRMEGGGGNARVERGGGASVRGVTGERREEMDERHPSGPNPRGPPPAPPELREKNGVLASASATVSVCVMCLCLS